MSKLTEEMKKFISENLAYIATVSEEGFPNIGPKRSCRIYDDNTLIFNENTAGQTMKNIENNSKAAVAFSDLATLNGFRFVGTAKVYTEGKYYDDCVEYAKGKMGAPKAATVITIEEIFTLKSGATAGTKIS